MCQHNTDNVEKKQKYKYANELISEIRRKTEQRDESITVFAAGHPQKLESEDEMKNLKSKTEAGVNVILTQLIFSAEIFCKFVRKCRQFGIPEAIAIIPGLYIPKNINELKLILNITKVTIPTTLKCELESLQNDEQKFQELSLSFITKLINDIQRDSPEHIRGFHFFTMNDLTMLSKLTKCINFSEA